MIVASDEPLDEPALDAARRAAGDGGRLVEDLDGYLDGAQILTDDHAPVDQLIAGGA